MRKTKSAKSLTGRATVGSLEVTGRDLGERFKKGTKQERTRRVADIRRFWGASVDKGMNLVALTWAETNGSGIS